MKDIEELLADNQREAAEFARVERIRAEMIVRKHKEATRAVFGILALMIAAVVVAFAYGGAIVGMLAIIACLLLLMMMGR